MRELFVWYRVRDEDVHAARAAVAAMQASLVDAWPGLRARRLERREAQSHTWMETYARAPSRADDGGIDAALEAAIGAAARSLADVIDGERHVEAFDATGSI